MNEPQFLSVTALSSAERGSHFIGKVADWEQLWSVRNQDGWLVPITPDGLEYFPVWPHPEYAQRITDMFYPGHKAEEISLDDFLSEWLPTLHKDNVKVAVFPNQEWVLWIMEPNVLAESLKQEMALYE